MFKTIVVATDFSELADAAVDRACEVAQERGADLHVLHVVHNLFLEPWVGYATADALAAEIERDESHAKIRLEEAMAKRGWKGRATIAVISDNGTEAAPHIVSYAREHHADLIVCGTHGRSGIGRLVLGSVAEQVLRTAPCAVLTVNGSAVGSAVLR
jgi:nucleotide-binding universal stress UspA family protein